MLTPYQTRNLAASGQEALKTRASLLRGVRVTTTDRKGVLWGSKCEKNVIKSDEALMLRASCSGG